MKRLAVRIGAALSYAWEKLSAAFGAREIGLLLGLSMLGYGAGAVYWPAGFILPGAILVYIAITGVN